MNPPPLERTHNQLPFAAVVGGDAHKSFRKYARLIGEAASASLMFAEDYSAVGLLSDWVAAVAYS